MYVSKTTPYCQMSMVFRDWEMDSAIIVLLVQKESQTVSAQWLERAGRCLKTFDWAKLVPGK